MKYTSFVLGIVVTLFISNIHNVKNIKSLQKRVDIEQEAMMELYDKNELLQKQIIKLAGEVHR